MRLGRQWHAESSVAVIVLQSLLAGCDSDDPAAPDSGALTLSADTVGLAAIGAVYPLSAIDVRPSWRPKDD